MAKVKLLDPSDPRRKLDRYELIGEIATGGMATVFLARRGGVGGFQRFVAIKRLHPHLANEPEFVEMFLDEARLAALIHHPNVVPILEVGESEAGYYLVMEYVEGDTLSRIVARTMSLGQMPPRHVILRMILDTLGGLHAAHELRDDRGQLLGLVHRDCSPQNVLVGVDGTARITDFGVARASARLTSTAHGKLKGKLAYMAPEQTRGDELDRRTDLFAMGIILWEVLCGKRLFKADSEAATLQRILVEPIRPPSEINPTIPKCFDDVVLKALDRNADKRYQTAGDIIDALEAAGKEAARNSPTDVGIASPREVASFVQTVLGQEIGAQRESVRAWLAQSDSGQQVVFSGIGSSPPRSPSKPATADLSMDDLPETDIDLPARPPSQVVHPSPTAPVEMPRFEVAADVTMRFALEPARPAIPPPAASPPPRAESVPASEPSSPPRLDPPRAPPPAKQSQRTLLGQGPAPAAVLAAAAANESAKNGAPKANGANGSNGSNGIPDLTAYTPHVDDDLEDLVTVARPANGPPPSAMVPAVKTARGLFAEPLLAEARARIEANGQASAPTKTPRMPQPADEAGVPEAKIALAASTLAMGDAAAGAAIVEAVPIASLPVPIATNGRAPRTLVSSTTEVSNGGFTPGSMTLSSSESALRHEVLDPTVIHTIPKRRYGKYFIVGIAFVLVFGTGILLLRDKLGLTSTPTEKTEAKVTATATSSPARVDSAKASATATSPAASASEEASAVELNASSDAVDTGSAKASSKVTHPANTSGATTRGTRPSKSSSAAPPGTQTTPPTAPTTAPTEDLSNPYKF